MKKRATKWLGIQTDKEEVIQASGQNIASGIYPMSRPLFVLSNGEPTGDAKVMVDFLLGEEGQELVRKHGYLALSDLAR